MPEAAPTPAPPPASSANPMQHTETGKETETETETEKETETETETQAQTHICKSHPSTHVIAYSIFAAKSTSRTILLILCGCRLVEHDLKPNPKP